MMSFRTNYSSMVRCWNIFQTKSKWFLSINRDGIPFGNWIYSRSFGTNRTRSGIGLESNFQHGQNWFFARSRNWSRNI